ncbi:MAG TPA: hypothetical protein VK175_06075 [Leadbetterella sp.]|nr:hypothetical protein [Leadbetterella sp.]
MRKPYRKVLEVQKAVMDALPMIREKVEQGSFVKEAAESCGVSYLDYWKYCPVAEREQIAKAWRMFRIGR